MNTINADNCLIIVIDVQEKLVNMLNNGEKLVCEAEKIVKAADILNIPIIITEQYPKGLGSTRVEIKSCANSAKYFEKSSFSVMNETGISEAVAESNKKQIVLFGIETHICVLQSAMDLLKSDYEVFVVKNASASRNDDDNETALRRLIHSGVQVITTEMAVFELLKSSKNPKFKEIQSLIK